MNIYSPTSDVFESLKTLKVDYDQLELDGQLIPLFIDVPWNKGLTGYTNSPCSEETKRNISNAKRGKPSAFKGKKHTEESKEKNRQAHKGKKLSLESIEKIRQKTIGQKRTSDIKQKMSNSRKEWLKTNCNPLKGIERSEEVKKKISDGKRGKKRVYREDGSFYMV